MRRSRESLRQKVVNLAIRVEKEAGEGTLALLEARGRRKRPNGEILVN